MQTGPLVDNQKRFTDEQYRIWRAALREVWVEDEWWRKDHPSPMPFDRRLDEVRRMTTHELLGLLQTTRKFGGWYSPESSGANWGYVDDDIKAELANRPHIPKRDEAKRLRRERALGHNR